MNVELTPLEEQALAVIAEEFGVDQRTALSLGLAALLDCMTPKERIIDPDRIGVAMKNAVSHLTNCLKPGSNHGTTRSTRRVRD